MENVSIDKVTGTEAGTKDEVKGGENEIDKEE